MKVFWDHDLSTNRCTASDVHCSNRYKFGS